MLLAFDSHGRQAARKRGRHGRQSSPRPETAAAHRACARADAERLAADRDRRRRTPPDAPPRRPACPPSAGDEDRDRGDRGRRRRGDPSFLKVLDRLDRYQKTAKVNQVYDDDARKKLFEKLNRVAANLGLAVIEDPAKAKEKPAPEPAPAPQLAAPEPPAEDKDKEKEKTPWGVGGTS